MIIARGAARLGAVSGFWALIVTLARTGRVRALTTCRHAQRRLIDYRRGAGRLLLLSAKNKQTTCVTTGEDIIAFCMLTLIADIVFRSQKFALNDKDRF